MALQPDQIPSGENLESAFSSPLSVLSELEYQIDTDLLPTTQETLVEKPQRGRKRKRWVIDYIDAPLRLPAKYKHTLSASGRLDAKSQTEPVVVREHTLLAPDDENGTFESNSVNGIASMKQPSVGASCSVEGEGSVSRTAHASSAMELDRSGEDHQLGQEGDNNLAEVSVDEREVAKLSDESSCAREGQTERITTRKLGSRTRTTKATARKQTKVQHGTRRPLVSRKEQSVPSGIVDGAEGDGSQQNTEHIPDQTLSDPPDSSAMVTPGPCARSVEPQSTAESDTAVTDSDGHVGTTFSGIPISEEPPLNQSNSNPDKWKETSNVTSGKKKIPTGPRRMTISTLESADEGPARPHKRLKAGKPSAGPKAQRQRRTWAEQREVFVSQEQNGAPSVAEALNTASTANQSIPWINRPRRNTQTQVERDGNSPVQIQEEERQQPSFAPQSKEEYEKRIHNLESCLAAAEARDPAKMVDQVFDVLFRRMKEVVSVTLQIVILSTNDPATTLDAPRSATASLCDADSCRT